MTISPTPQPQNPSPGSHRSWTRWLVGALGLTGVAFVGFFILYADNGLTASHPMVSENFNGWMVAQVGTLLPTVLEPLVLGTIWAAATGRRPGAPSRRRPMVVGSLIALMMTLSIFACFVLTGAAFTLALESMLLEHAVTWADYAASAQSVLVDPVAMQRLATALALSALGGAAVGLGLDRVRRQGFDETAASIEA